MRQTTSIGSRFGKLVVVAGAPPKIFPSQGHPHAVWRVRCDCGIEKEVLQSNLHSGRTRSCGCEVLPGCAQWHKLHGRDGFGHQHRDEWIIWYHMLRRCNDPSYPSYPDYGGRGIRVCERWAKSFRTFYEDVAPRPSRKYSLDRVNNNGDYSLGNIRWATQKQQARNKRSNRILRYEGRKAPMAQWAEEFELHKSTLFKRLALGWSVTEALTRPVRR